MQYKSVIFDLDGTLINSLADLAASVNLMLAGYGFSTFSTEEYRYKVGDGARKLIERSLPADKAGDEHFVTEALDKYQKIYEEHTGDLTKPYDGIIEMLHTLKEKGVSINICTNKPQGATDIIVKEMLGQIKFDQVWGDSDGLPRKPNPAKVRKICEAVKVPPAATVFMGDSAVDMQTAVNGGCLPVGVLWGFREREELIAGGAKILLARPQELFRQVEF